ncbi:hypothetical protein [Pseudomonas sp. PDM14]|nr:hypothetical protein [Pseudomonas sp. PDM14]
MDANLFAGNAGDSIGRRPTRGTTQIKGMQMAKARAQARQVQP